MTRKRPRRSGTSGSVGKIIAIVVAAAIIISAGVVFVPRLVHHCDRCNKLFVGTGYYGNVLTNTMSSLQGRNNKILCSECARDDHAVEIFAGKTLDDFRRPLFEADGD